MQRRVRWCIRFVLLASSACPSSSAPRLQSLAVTSALLSLRSIPVIVRRACAGGCTRGARAGHNRLGSGGVGPGTYSRFAPSSSQVRGTEKHISKVRSRLGDHSALPAGPGAALL